MTLAEG